MGHPPPWESTKISSRCPSCGNLESFSSCITLAEYRPSHQLSLLILITRYNLYTRFHLQLLANMKSSTILPVAALGSLGQAVWPSPLSASKPTTHSLSYHAPLETISLPSVPSTQTFFIFPSIHRGP